MQEKLLLRNEKSHTCVVNSVNLTRLFEKSREKYGLWFKKNKKNTGSGVIQPDPDPFKPFS